MIAGREFEDWIAEPDQDGEAFAGRRQLVGEVAFVEDDQRGDLLAFGGEQRTGDQFIVEGRFGGDDDDDLVDVGSNQFWRISLER